MDFRQSLREKLLSGIIRGCGDSESFRIMVVDETTLHIISSLYKITEMVDYNVPCIEMLAKKRQPMNVEVIYFIEPTLENAKLMISDFETAEDSLYPYCHLFTSYECSADFIKIIKNAGNFVSRLCTFKEAFISLLCPESKVFSTNLPRAFEMLTQSSGQESVFNLIQRTSDDLVNVCLTLGVIPQIYNYKTSTACETVANEVHRKLQSMKNDFASGLKVASSDKLIILERGVDALTPLLHDCHLQAMAHDLLDINKNVYSFKRSNGAKAENILDDSDEIWSSVKHLHIAEAMQSVPRRIKEFVASQPGVMKSGTQESSFSDLKNILSHLILSGPTASLLEANISICDTCFQTFQTRRLDEVSKLEQNLATGFDENGDKLVDPQRALFKINQSSRGDDDKIRATMIYCLSQAPIPRENFNVLVNSAEINDKVDTMMKFQKIGVPFLTDMEMSVLTAFKRRKYTFGEGTFLTSRYTPVIKDIILDLAENSLNPTFFSCVNPSDDGNSLGIGFIPFSSNSKSSIQNTSYGSSGSDMDDFGFGKYKSSHSKKISTSAVGGGSSSKVVIFIIGGITYSEMRCIYECNSNIPHLDILIGGTEVLTPKTFLQRLSDL